MFSLCKIENMKADCFSQTNDFIISYLEDYTGHGPQQTYVCFERAVLGKELTIEERKLFWNSIIFYNYIQFSQKGPRQNIEEEQSNVSEKAFKELLEKYKPDYIIIWGARLYDRLPDWGGKHSVLSVGRDSTDIWTYSIKGKSIPAMKVLHPSTPVGKSWPYWHKFYQKFLGM